MNSNNDVRPMEVLQDANASPIGDWKVSKCMEYQLMGMELPYDVNELHKKRQEVRDKINMLQSELLNIE